MHRGAVLIALMAGWPVAASAADLMPADLMPHTQQNALVQKYCAVCHTEAVKNGGLSLEHFDAAQAAPSLTAMLLSKLSGGVSLETVRKAGTDADATALVNRKMKSGAIGAAGIPIPDKATIDGWIRAFAVESTGATEWTVEHTIDGMTASILREVRSIANPGEAREYRLVMSCNPAARGASLQLAWSPVARNGMLTASADGKAAMRYAVEGKEKMGNASGVVTSGLAALVLAGLPLPAESLTVGDLFPGETVEFPLANFPREARHEFEACFANADAQDR